MGLKDIVRKELDRRGLKWTRKAPQAVPNKADAARLQARQEGHKAILERNKTAPQGKFTMPGSYRK